MTVSASATYPQPFACNGSLTTFDFDFGVSATSEVEVIHKVNTTEVETTLEEGVDYAISATNSDYSDGGRITTTETYASGITLIARMVIVLTQAANFTEGMATLYESFERGLDKLTRIDQQQGERIDRCLSFTDASGETGNGILPVPAALKVLQWNTDGDALQNLTVSDLVNLTVHIADKDLHGDGAVGEATIASGILTVDSTASWWKVDGQGGADDTLDSIAGMVVGDVKELTPVDDTTTIIVAYSASILLGDKLNFTMNNQYDSITVRCISSGVVREISRMNFGG